MLVLIVDRLKTINHFVGWKFHLIVPPSAITLAAPCHPYSRKDVGSGAFSAGMLDFIPLPRILPGLLARGDSWYTSAMARDRYPFLLLIWNPGVFPFRLAHSTSHSSFSLVFFLPGNRKLLSIPSTMCFPRDARSSLLLLVCLFISSFLFHSFFWLLSGAIGCNRLWHFYLDLESRWLKIYDIF